MRAAARRLQLLGRLLARAEAEERAAAAALSGAAAALLTAEGRRQALAGLIAETGAQPGAVQVTELSAAAQLRLMLQPAADAARTALEANRTSRREAEERVQRARARSEKLANLVGEGRRAARAEAETRAADSVPPRIGRQGIPGRTQP